MTSKRAFVTGATGFLGRNLCGLLVDNGWDVTALRRRTSDVSDLQGHDLDWAVADILNQEAICEAVTGHQYVFHLAGIGLMDADAATVRRVNVQGTANVLNACRTAGADRLVFTSTAGTRRSHEPPATEADVAAPVGAYQESKAEAEQLVENYTDEGGDAVTVHPTSVFGPGDEKFTQKMLFLASNPIPVYLPGGVSIVSVDDISRGIVAAMERGTAGEHYILGGENLTFGEALDVLASFPGHSRPPVKIPAVGVHAAGYVIGALNRVVGTRMFPVNSEMAHLSTRRLFYSSSKAEAELGYTYEPLASHASRAIDWFQGKPIEEPAGDVACGTDSRPEAPEKPL